MDLLDQQLDGINSAQEGAELTDRTEIPQALQVGNHLSDALELAEQALGAIPLARHLEDALRGIEPSAKLMQGRLRHALWLFRQNVSPVDYHTRLTNRIKRLRGNS